MQYQVGGSLINNAPSYVAREADQQFYQALKNGEFCYILNSRQMGKSSLLVHTRHRLEAEGYICTALDLSGIGSENMTPLQWYKGVVTNLWLSLKLVQKFSLKKWWQDLEDMPLLQKLNHFILELLNNYFPNQHLFIFIDEIDSVMSLPFSTDDFFAFIRFCYNQRAIAPEYKRISFAIFGVATPSDLINDKQRTPFNIGQAIPLSGFTLEEAQPLIPGLAETRSHPEETLEEVLKWTAGQPFLTQKLCKIVVNCPEKSVDEIVRSQIIENWESQDEPEHLRTIRNRILFNEETSGRLLGIYQKILLEGKVKSDDGRDFMELLLSGLIVNKKGYLQVKNLIYENVFNQDWVAKQLENMRPYALKMRSWLDSKKQNNDYLLKGLELKEALAWSTHKQLSDIDYRFLKMSQELTQQETENYLAVERSEREKAEFALSAAKEANLILNKARKAAYEQSKFLRLGKRWIAGLAGGVTASLILLRFTGLLQGFEWTVLDWFFQSRPTENIAPHLTVITINERDLREMGQYPIPDDMLANILNQIKQSNPRQIGLGLFRDIPVPSGTEKLSQVFRTTPNLIGLEKVAGNAIDSPEILKKEDQVGFADHILDGDGKVRRAILSLRSEDQTVSYSFALKIALEYLAKENIKPSPLPNKKMQLGKAVLTPLRGNEGGYVRAKTGGFQILLNYWGTEQQFQTYSLTDLLNSQIPEHHIHDRIILLGPTAESINDFFQTPYSSRITGIPQQMPGIILQANIIAQLLNGALYDRPMLRVWPEGVEWAWMFLWSLLGAAIAWQTKSLLWSIFCILGSTGGLFAIAYLLFLQGWWIPIISPCLAFGITFSLIAIVTNRQAERIQLYHIVHSLEQTRQEKPTVGHIAIEYLKQGESPEHQKLIEQLLQENINPLSKMEQKLL